MTIDADDNLVTEELAAGGRQPPPDTAWEDV
jgi:hypothetical protein